jgi:2',3'-cyclic-nucleotide 2'-phosphodiesterase (5'-nucleotidase family)
MQKMIILHTNDIHGHIEGLARVATLVEQVRGEHPDLPVLYFDAGDVEETAQRLSNLTKGVAMHRLLSAAGCNAVTAGNGGLPRYSPHILQAYAAASSYPHVLANLLTEDGRVLDGAQATLLLPAGSCMLGIIGVTATTLNNGSSMYELFHLQTPPVIPLVRDLAADLRKQGADIIILLSHLGLPEDILTTLQLQESVDVVIGAHTHNLAPAGVWNGKVLLAQAGAYAEYLGRLDLTWNGEDGGRLHVDAVSVQAVTEEVALHPRVQDEIATIERDIEQKLNEVIGEVAEPLTWSEQAESGVANLMADALRSYMDADVALIEAGIAFVGPLPAGLLRRLTLWEICSAPANPAVVEMTGAQLALAIARGQDPAKAALRPRSHRGYVRGFLHISGASLRQGQLFIGSQVVEPERLYRVAASDWELDPENGYVDAAWGLQPMYDTHVILREVVEAYLQLASPVAVQMGRLECEEG